MTKEENRRLVEKYPFLLPHNRWTEKKSDSYDYSYTELDNMPQGWRQAFGEELCKEIKQELESTNNLDNYRITDIKEKYGLLRWYDFGGTEKMAREIIPEYVTRSKYTCIRCGIPATKISIGWISPYCDECANKISHYEHFVDIDAWYKESEHEMEEGDEL